MPAVAAPGLGQEAYPASAPESLGDPEEVPELDPELPDELPLELSGELPEELPEESLLAVESVSLASLGPPLLELLLEQAARAMSKIDAALLVSAIRRSVIR